MTVAPLLRLAVSVAALVGAHVGTGAALAVEIGPEADLCAEMNQLPPGGELVLRPGQYRGPCTIRQGGTAGTPVVIRAQDLQQRPQIVYTGARSNVIDVKADHVVIRGLRFGPTQGGVDGVRIYARQDVVIEDCEFTGLGGIAVVASHTSVRDLVVRRNIVRESRSTAMYFGCHDGAACTVTGLVVERNFIQTVRAVDPEIGYGIQLKLNSIGAIRDNVVVDTKGPGIMVYGSRDLTAQSVVERNLLVGSLRSSGIVVGGGPALVRNNVAVNNNDAGIGLEDYGHRGLLRDVVVTHNTFHDNRAGGITVAGTTFRGIVAMNNAVHARPGTAPLPAPQPGLRVLGNVVCAAMPCFIDPAALDFSPAPGGVLHGAAAVRADALAPADDFFGVRRGVPPTVGAIEAAGGSIQLGLKP